MNYKPQFFDGEPDLHSCKWNVITRFSIFLSSNTIFQIFVTMKMDHAKCLTKFPLPFVVKKKKIMPLTSRFKRKQAPCDWTAGLRLLACYLPLPPSLEAS